MKLQIICYKYNKNYTMQCNAMQAIQWLKDNEMVANPSKFELLFLSKYQNIEKNMSFDGKTIKS